ncbi:MAG TPA: hypothetical protein VFL29_03440, partial [Candidatus Dormibacteraeota bacterium]|nr:hypothetical protein [Candidatus Dormibacteraeota bacterium]
MRLAAAVFVAILLSTANSNPAKAAGDPYTPGEHGYDISYPQCGLAPPRTGTFAVLGVNWGSPFSGNPCLVDQYMNAPRSAPPSLYINTGYEDQFAFFITSNCKSQSHSITGLDIERRAWAIGCSEAETSIEYAYRLGASSIAMWWLDVEVINKWSQTLSLNRFTLQGAVTRLTQTDLPVGIYSSFPMWIQITGVDSVPGNINAEWNAAHSCAPFTPLVNVPVWLS